MYCGGEVPAKSTKCPYCGRENQSGIAFEREVREKEARNRALGDEILKKNLPWLTRKMLTRIIVVTAVLNVVLFFSTFLMFLWSDRAPAVKEAKAGSAAERYLRNFETEDYYCGNFIESMNDYIGAKTDGTEMKAYYIESMVRHGFYLAQQIYDDKMGAEEKEEAAALLEVFLRIMSDCRRNTAIFTGRKNGVPATMNSARHQGMRRFPGSVKRRAWTDGIYHFSCGNHSLLRVRR